MKDMLGRIARTALLCGALGLLLYAVLAYAVESPTLAPLLPPLLGVAGSVLLLVLTGHDMLSAWRSGEFAGRGAPIRREQEPAWFGGCMAWQGVAALCLLALLLYSFSLLMDVWSSFSDADLRELWARLLRQEGQ
jgi:hypothetical protein